MVEHQLKEHYDVLDFFKFVLLIENTLKIQQRLNYWFYDVAFLNCRPVMSQYFQYIPRQILAV